MSGLILKAIVTGLVLSVMLGPAFFVLLETSIKKGIRSALVFDAGVLISDVIYIIVAYVFIQQVEELSHGNDNALIRAIGGVMFLTYGTINFFKKIKDFEENNENREKENRESKNYLTDFLKGLLLNLVNPMVVFYWFSVMAFGRSGSPNALSPLKMFIFLAIVLSVFFTIDILKIVGAKKLRSFITINVLSSLNRIIGSILILFGLFLIINSIVIWLR